MMNPARPTEKYILGRISYHESQVQWFADHNLPSLAKWARSMVETWQEKLEALKVK